MLHPSQFEVNQTWIVFQINTTPIPTESEGDFDCVALMDAASCFILSQTLAAAGESGPSFLAIRQSIAEAKAHKEQLPKTLLIPNGQFTTLFPEEVERQGVPTEAKLAGARALNEILHGDWPGFEIEARFPLRAIAEAHETIEQRRLSGRVVINIQDERLDSD